MTAHLETIRVALPNGWALARDLAGGWAWIRPAPPQPQTPTLRSTTSRNVLPMRQPTAQA